MPFDKEQVDTITGLVKKAQTEFVESDDFTSALTKIVNSAASETVNKAITSKLKSFGNSLEGRMAELIKEAVPVKEDDDEPKDKDPKGGDTDFTKSKAYRDLNKKHETLTQEVESERAKREAVEVQAFNNERDAALIGFASKGNAIDPELVRDALRAGVTRDEDGSLVVKTTKDGEETVQPLQEVVDSHLKARSFLVKTSGTGGAGSSEGSDGGAGGGGGGELDKSTYTNTEKYMAAREKGLIKGVPAAQKTDS